MKEYSLTVRYNAKDGEDAVRIAADIICYGLQRGVRLTGSGVRESAEAKLDAAMKQSKIMLQSV